MFATLDIKYAIHYARSMMKTGTFRLTNRLRVARAERRLSQAELARLAGVTRQTIGAIENGQYVPSALLAFVLAQRLGMPVAELFALEGEES